MRNAIALLAVILLSGCITIPEYDPVKFEERADHIERVVNKPYDELYQCLVSRTNIPVHTYITKEQASYSIQGFLKIDFYPIGKNATKVKARSIGSYAKASHWMTVMDLECVQSKPDL